MEKLARRRLIYKKHMTLAVILIFPSLGFGENEAAFCKPFSGMTKTQINDKFLGRRGQFGYDDFYALLDRIGKGG